MERTGVLVGGLKSDLDNVKGLACRGNTRQLVEVSVDVSTFFLCTLVFRTK